MSKREERRGEKRPDEKTLGLLRQRLIASGAAPAGVFERRTRRVPAGQCPRKHGPLPPDSKFCGECGTPTAFGPGVKARTEGLTTARSRVGGRIARLCSAGCGRVVQSTSRGVVVKESSGFVFRRCCEPCNRAISIVRGEIELWAKGGDDRAKRLAVILTVHGHTDGAARARRLNDERRSPRGEAADAAKAEATAPAPAAAPEDPERAAFRADAEAMERRFRERLEGKGEPCLTVRDTCAFDHQFCGEPQGWLAVEGTIFPLCYRACSAFVEARKGLMKDEVPPLFTSREGAEEFAARGKKGQKGPASQAKPEADAADDPEAAPAEPKAPKLSKPKKGKKESRGGRREDEDEAHDRLTRARERKTPKPNGKGKNAKGNGTRGNGDYQSDSERLTLGDALDPDVLAQLAALRAKLAAQS